MPKPITRNTLFYGDNLSILREHIADESVDLIYLDPPFNSNRSYNVLLNGKGIDCRLTRRVKRSRRRRKSRSRKGNRESWGYSRIAHTTHCPSQNRLSLIRYRPHAERFET